MLNKNAFAVAVAVLGIVCFENVAMAETAPSDSGSSSTTTESKTQISAQLNNLALPLEDVAAFNRSITKKIISLGNIFYSKVGPIQLGLMGKFGYNLKPDHRLELEIGSSGGVDLFHSIFLGGNESRGMELASIRYRYFVGNSFNLQSGLQISRYTVSGQSTEPFTGIKNSYSAEVQTFRAGFGIGNEWQNDGFVFGIDWIRFEQGLGSQVTRKSFTNSATDVFAFEDDVKSNDIGASAYLGYAF